MSAGLAPDTLRCAAIAADVALTEERSILAFRRRYGSPERVREQERLVAACEGAAAGTLFALRETEVTP